MLVWNHRVRVRVLVPMPFPVSVVLQKTILSSESTATVKGRAELIIARHQAQIEQETDRLSVQDAPLEQTQDVHREGPRRRIVQAAHLRQQH